MAWVKLDAVESTYTDYTAPAVNFGNSLELKVYEVPESTTLYTKKIYVKYDTTPLEGKRMLGAMRFYFYQPNPWGSKESYQYFYVAGYKDPWEEDAITYQNEPKYVMLEARNYMVSHANYTRARIDQAGWIFIEGSRPIPDDPDKIWDEKEEYNGYRPFYYMLQNGARIALWDSRNNYEGVYHSTRAANKPYMLLDCAGVVVEPANMEPAAGYMDDTVPNAFSWDFTYDAKDVIGEVTGKSAQFQWRALSNPGVVNTIDVPDAWNEVTVPEDTFPERGQFEWRVRVITFDGTVGNWGAWSRISTYDDSSIKARYLLPNMDYVDAGITNRLTWIAQSELGSGASRSIIEISQDGVNWTKIADQATRNAYYDTPPDTFSNGIAYWRVLLYNIEGLMGEWSDPAMLTVHATLDPPQVISFTNTNRPAITWAAKNQFAYQIQIYRNNMLVYDTEMRSGFGNTHKVDVILENGAYDVWMRIADQFERESGWSHYAASVRTTPTTDIVLAAEVQTYSVNLEWELTGSMRDAIEILRDGRVIAYVEGVNAYQDYTAAGEHEYSVRMLQNDILTESNKVVVTLELPGRVIAPVATPEDVLLCNLSTEKDTFRYATGKSATYVKLDGREKPLALQDEHINETLEFIYAELNEADKNRLEAFARDGGTYIFRDDYGKSEFVVIDPIEVQRNKEMYVYVVALTAVDYKEEQRADEGYVPLYARSEQFITADDEEFCVKWRQGKT